MFETGASAIVLAAYEQGQKEPAELLCEAKLQLEYINERYRMGTTTAVIARLDYWLREKGLL